MGVVLDTRMRVALSFVLCLFSIAAMAESGRKYGTSWDDPTVRSWTCSGSVFYNMSIKQENNPNGGYEPIGEAADIRLSVQLKKSSENDNRYCGRAGIGQYYFYIARATPNAPWSLFQTAVATNACHQTMTYYGPIEKMEDTTAQIEDGFSNVTLLLRKDDADWRFIISHTNLDTVRSVRHLKVTVPTARNQPEAGVSFTAGVCIEDKYPNNSTD